MSRRGLIVASIALLAGGALAACGDDGNDRAQGAPRGGGPGEEVRSGSSVPEAADPATDPGSAPAPTRPAADTTVAATGVIVPVVALDNSFRPQRVEIDLGDEVRWENRGLNEHDVLRVVGDGWGVDVDDFQPGDVYAHVFTETGEFRYFCSIHGNEDVGMIGTVVVRP